MRRILTFLIVLLSGGLLVACTTQPESKTHGPKLNPNGSVTTVYMVRHAEKEKGDDPALTDNGKKRAERLAKLLKNENVVKVYSTETRREFGSWRPKRTIHPEQMVSGPLTARLRQLAVEPVDQRTRFKPRPFGG